MVASYQILTLVAKRGAWNAGSAAAVADTGLRGMVVALATAGGAGGAGPRAVSPDVSGGAGGAFFICADSRCRCQAKRLAGEQSADCNGC